MSATPANSRSVTSSHYDGRRVVSRQLTYWSYWSAIDRRGRARSGVSVDPPAVVTERLFQLRMRSAKVKQDGRVVGEIGPAATGERTWWAES